MPVFISLLRGVNVVGRKKIKMDELRALYLSLKFEDARTFIQSGNVIFRTRLPHSQKNAAALAKKIQDAIAHAQIVLGMSREQVLMSVGYPVSSENHNLEDKTWRFWLSSFQEFRVRFDDNGRVSDVEGDGDAKSKVLLD